MIYRGGSVIMFASVNRPMKKGTISKLTRESQLEKADFLLTKEEYRQAVGLKRPNYDRLLCPLCFECPNHQRPTRRLSTNKHNAHHGYEPITRSIIKYGAN